MPHSDELKVFWFTPMRAATRSCINIQTYFNFLDISTHQFFDGKLPHDYFFISNVRNPYSRLVSIYKLFCFGFKLEPTNFRNWVIKKLKEEVETPSQTLDYQINLSSIYSRYNRIPDYLIKVESIENDIRNLWFVKNSMSEELETIIQESILKNQYVNEFGEGDHWQEYYNESLSNYVYSYLEKDFLLLGYDKNSWKNGTP